MNLWIRVDASLEIGTGHVYRCLNIAKELAVSGIHSHFICRAFDGHLIDLIVKSGFEVIELEAELKKSAGQPVEPVLKHSHWLHSSQYDDALHLQRLLDKRIKQTDCILVDHFALDCTWERLVSEKFNCSTVVIDGQADRQHCSHLVVDPNLSANDGKWKGLLIDGTQLKTGISYVPLDASFEELDVVVRKRLDNLVIGFGGVDRDNYTMKALKVAVEMPITIQVVVGKHYPYLGLLKNFCKQYSQVSLDVQTSNMVRIMSDADLAIGAGGTMTFERCMAGLPSLVTVIAENQKNQVLAAVDMGIAQQIPVTNYEASLAEALNEILEEPKSLMQMSIATKSIAENREKMAWTKLFCSERQEIR